MPTVIIGATPEGKKELDDLIGGVQSAQSWREPLLDLKRGGLTMGSELAIADGFWRGMPQQGSRRTAGLLRLPGRALKAFTHDERHRKRIRDGSSPHGAP
jgi:hypothetical protein